MFYESKTSGLKIEALVDANGKYSRVMVTKGNARRVLFLSYGVVDTDEIFEFDDEEEMFPNKTYTAFDDPYREKTHPSLKEYFSQNIEFKSEDGAKYTGDVSNNTYIVQFFNANTELIKRLGEQKGSGRSK